MLVNKSELEKLIKEIIKAKQKYELLVFDEKYSYILGPSASKQQIVFLEKKLGMPLPSSYRMFLELYNGWVNFHAGGNLLSIEDQGRNWVKDRINFWNNIWDGETKNPFDCGAIPIFLGNNLNHFLVLDPNRSRENGSIDFVVFDNMAEFKSYDDFSLFLEHELDLMKMLIDREVNGVSDAED